MNKLNSNNISDVTIIKRLISMLPASIEHILGTDADDELSLNAFMLQCLGLSVELGEDVKKSLKEMLDKCNLDKVSRGLVNATVNSITESEINALIDATDSISKVEGIKIPEDKKPSKRNDDELNNEVIIKACSMLLVSIINYGKELAKIKVISEKTKEDSFIVKQSCQVNMMLILGLIDKLGMKPEDAIKIAVSSSLAITEDGEDKHEPTKSEIEDIIDEIKDYLPCTLSECTNAVYAMLD